MSSEGKKHSRLLDQLAHFMAEEVEGMSYQDLLDETGGAGGLAFIRSQRLKRLLEQRAIKARQDRLVKARTQYAVMIASRIHTPRHRPAIGVIKEKIKSLFTQDGHIPFAVAWRNGEYQSDSDLLSLWDQLCDLGAFKDTDR
jgi:hypothetical protein